MDGSEGSSSGKPLPPTPTSASSPRFETGLNRPRHPPKDPAMPELPNLSIDLRSPPTTIVPIPSTMTSSIPPPSGHTQIGSTPESLSSPFDTPPPSSVGLSFDVSHSPSSVQPTGGSTLKASRSLSIRSAGAAPSTKSWSSRTRRASSFRSIVRPSVALSPLGDSPLGDFQSDDVLNAPPFSSGPPSPQPVSPVAGPVAHVGRPVALNLDTLSEVTHLPTPDTSTLPAAGAITGAVVSNGQEGWNPFRLPGVQEWTRENWGQRKIALISGITGQDGSYLTELLLEKGYIVHGIIRRSSSFNTSRLHHLFADHHDGTPRMILHYGDLTDSTNLVYIISQVQPSEIYNLGAQSHVKVSFEMAEYTGDVDGLGTLRLLDAVRTCGLEKLVRFYQASTSEMFGKVRETPQSETTPFYPRSPYGVAKLYSYWTTINYREAYGMFACNGILFNHESPRRGRTFVTRKITRAVAEISLGKQECMFMGNLDALRDWGHAMDYVEGMWRVLQHDQPEDFVLASGTNHSVREFIERSFEVVGMKVRWEGHGVSEVGFDVTTGQAVVRVDPKYFRPAEVDQLLGDASKALKLLGWKPTVTFEDLIKEMVLSDVASAKHLVEDHN